MTTSTIAAQTRPASRAVRRRRRHVGSYLLVTLVVLVFLLPLLFLVNTSLKTTAAFNRDPIGLVTAPAWSNFVDAWVQGDFARYVVNSVGYTLSAALIGTAVSVLLAFPVARGFLAGSQRWSLLFAFVLFLPNALITQFQLLLRLHLYGTPLGYVLIMSAGVGVGPLLMSGFVRSIPQELDEAAALDGVGYWQYVWRFVVPLARPAIVTVFVLQAIWVWNEIILATVLLTSQTESPITLGLYRFQGTYANQWGLLAAATLIVAAPLVTAYLFLQRFITNGIAGSVKG